MSRQPYVRPLPRASWYFGNARYRRYMLREVTCLLVGPNRPAPWWSSTPWRWFTTWFT